MSRKVILSLATAATIITAGLASSAADARGGGGGGGHSGGGGAHFASGGHVGGSHFSGRGGRGSRIASVHNPGRGDHPGHGHPGHWAHWNHHHWVFRDGVWIDSDVGYEAVGETPVVAAPGPCTCLTKTYTSAGLVVFADVCTKEAASARVDGNATDATPAPTPTPSNAPVDDKASDATQAPTSSNYAGRTFQDFLAANAQAASAQKN